MRYNFLTSSQIIRRITMAKSSINFQKTKPNSTAETTREFEAKYLLKKEYRQENSYWNCGKSDREIYKEQRAIYDEVKKGRGKRPGYENCVWEAVVNFNADHTLEDMKKVSEHIAKKFNIIPTRIAMHRDEGHLNSNGEVVYNYHAHLNFVTLKDAQQNWTISKTKHKLSDLQTEVAEILGMERGKFQSEAKRLDHKQYRVEAKAREQRTQEQEKLKAELEAEILTLKERNAILEQERKESKGKGFLKGFFDSLSSIKKSDQEFSKDELLTEIERLKALDKQRREENKRLQRQQEQQLKQQNKTIKAQEIQLINLKQENSALKNFISKAMAYVGNHAKDVFSYIKNIFSNELTEPLLNDEKKDEEFIDRSKETQQRSNLPPLEPKNKEQDFKQTLADHMNDIEKLEDELKEIISEPKKYRIMWIAKDGKVMAKDFTQSQYNKLDDKLKARCKLIQEPKQQTPKRERER